MIPDLVDIGAPFRVLPPGIHLATLEEVQTRYAYNSRRKHLFKGLCQACAALSIAGCDSVFLDGSFIAGKPYPNDYDACYCLNAVDRSKLDSILCDFSSCRANQKQKYRGEFLPADEVDGPSGKLFASFFQQDRFTGKPKGIVLITDLKDAGHLS